MRGSILMSAGVLTVSLFVGASALAKCTPDSVEVGPLCVDKYEASVWEIPSENRALIKKVQSGKATLAELTAGGAIQRGITTDDYPCSVNGNDCKDEISAVSIPGVTPARFITWFQAQQACANAGKRLLTNAEWQMAAAGTPDPGTDNGTTDCNITTTTGTLPEDPVNTGSRSNCVSAWGAFDMVGNLEEWVADWIQDNSDIDNGSMSTPTFGNDVIAGIDEAAPETDCFPVALIRGGRFNSGTNAGVFALYANNGPSSALDIIGFRCGR